MWDQCPQVWFDLFITINKMHFFRNTCYIYRTWPTQQLQETPDHANIPNGAVIVMAYCPEETSNNILQKIKITECMYVISMTIMVHNLQVWDRTCKSSTPSLLSDTSPMSKQCKKLTTQGLQYVSANSVHSLKPCSNRDSFFFINKPS